jgi:hypothetical protein
MKNSHCKSSLVVIVVAVLLLNGCATSSEKKQPLASGDDARAYFEVLRSDFNTAKISTINQVMKLTEAEADKFWPIYRSYEKDLAAVSDRKLALVREFFGYLKEGKLNDTNSNDVATRWLQNVQDRLDLWKQYHQKISQAVSPMRAGQFLQVENQLALFVDISIASEMPMIGGTVSEKR